MPIQVTIPTLLRTLTRNRDLVEASGSTVGEIIASLNSQYPSIEDRLVNRATGKLQRNAQIYVNDEDVRFLNDINTPISAGDRVEIQALSSGG